MTFKWGMSQHKGKLQEQGLCTSLQVISFSSSHAVLQYTWQGRTLCLYLYHSAPDVSNLIGQRVQGKSELYINVLILVCHRFPGNNLRKGLFGGGGAITLRLGIIGIRTSLFNFHGRSCQCQHLVSTVKLFCFFSATGQPSKLQGSFAWFKVKYFE